MGGAHRYRNTASSKLHLRHIDGLRGIAILMVVMFHLFVFKVSAGVDIFLFIGGLFILNSQLSQAVSQDGLTVWQSLIRLIRRLTPSMTIVVSFGTAVLMVLYSPSDWWGVFRDTVSALTYSINWTLGLSGEEYTKIGNAPSVFQHLWSMSIQMQIYVFIIFMVYATARVTKNNKMVSQRVLIPVVGVLSVMSFCYAIYLHNHNQTLNYYSTFSRFWEIGLGILVGYVLSKGVVFTTWIRLLLSTVGVIMLSITGLFLDGAQQFPGPLTLIPLTGAALIALTGSVEPMEDRTLSSLGVVRILETRVCVWLGNIAYSLYLWHWVIGILVGEVTPEWAQWQRSLVTLVVSLAVAEFSYRCVEKPLRQGIKPRRGNIFSGDYIRSAWHRTTPYVRIMSIVVIVLWCVGSVSHPVYAGYTKARAVQAQHASERYGGFFNAYPGARSIIPGVSTPDGVGIQPSPHNDVFTMMPPDWFDGCYTGMGDDQLHMVKKDGGDCSYGDVSSKKTLYAIGGSHTEQYLTALDNIGKKRGVRVVPIIKMGCPLVNEGKLTGGDFSDCDRWSENAAQWILSNPPTEGVFITSTRPSTKAGMGPDHVPESYVNLFRRFSDAGIYIYAVRDNPWMMAKDKDTHQHVDVQLNAKTCISGGGSAEECGMEQDKVLDKVNPALQAYQGMKGIQHIDFTPLFCQNGVCPAVIGNVLVYRDSNHLSDIFVKSMEPFIESAIFNDGWDASKVGNIMSQMGEQELRGEQRELPEWASTVTPEDIGASQPYVDKEQEETTTVVTPDVEQPEIPLEEIPDV